MGAIELEETSMIDPLPMVLRRITLLSLFDLHTNDNKELLRMTTN